MKKQKSFLRDLLEVIVASVVLFLLLNNFVADAREIPSPSMVPTINVGDRLMVEKVSLHFTDIKRGDIVVFAPPPNINVKDDLIKRVIGLPGDEVKIRNRVVYINNIPLNEPYITDKPRQDFGPVKVPPSRYFMMGDNRNNSYDSRFWGTVARDKIKGKAVFIFFPFKDLTFLEK